MFEFRRLRSYMLPRPLDSMSSCCRSVTVEWSWLSLRVFMATMCMERYGQRLMNSYIENVMSVMDP